MVKYCDVKKLVANTKADRWWEKSDKKKSKDQKWNELRHNGVLFPEPYKPLPKEARVKVNGKPVDLDAKDTNNEFNVTSEEAAMFFAMKLEQDRRLKEKRAEKNADSEDSVFRKNFWNDWKKILKNKKISSLSDVDFSPMVKYIVKRSEEKKEERKKMTREQKQEEKEKKEEIKELYGYAIIDGVKIPLGSYMIQPPGLYIGHGNHPKRGKIKARMKPEDITLNVSKDHVPKCESYGKKCKWGDIIENKEVTWIATWTHPITKDKNYVNLKREQSHWVCMDDLEKFEKARKLDKNIDKIRKKYKNHMHSGTSEQKQLATAVYLLDELAIRPGTEKDETKEAGTLGLTTLKCNNIELKGNNTVKINFTGKSSIKFERTVKISPFAYEYFKNACKKKSDALFPLVSANSLNAYLKTLLPGISAKVFRTWKASSILQEELNKNIPSINESTDIKKLTYDRVNIAVAHALNHKRMSKNDDRIKKLKDEIKKLKQKEANTATQKANKQKAINSRLAKLEEAEGNIALTTSKVNYLDPRISVSWAKKVEIPIEKIYNKTQLVKFVWAMDTNSSWNF